MTTCGIGFTGALAGAWYLLHPVIAATTSNIKQLSSANDSRRDWKDLSWQEKAGMRTILFQFVEEGFWKELVGVNLPKRVVVVEPTDLLTDFHIQFRREHVLLISTFLQSLIQRFNGSCQTSLKQFFTIHLHRNWLVQVN